MQVMHMIHWVTQSIESIKTLAINVSLEKEGDVTIKVCIESVFPH